MFYVIIFINIFC